MIRTWEINKTSNEEIYFADNSSLDAITKQLPEGYYSTFRTYDACKRVLGLTAHLHRLYDPVHQPEVDASSLRQRLLTLLDPFRPTEARVRLIMTPQGKAHISIEQLAPLPPTVYEEGVHVETTEVRRESPRLKSTTFIGSSQAERKHIAREGIFEALLVRHGKILEGMTSNFFYVFAPDGTPLQLGTARDDILLGVTRRIVIRLASGRGLDMRYRPLRLNQLSAVSEAFITSSSRGLVPVIQINDMRMGQGRPGPITKQLSAAYETLVTQKAEKIWDEERS